MRSFWKSAVLLLSIAASVSAQNHPMPGAVPDPPVICTGCPGTNSVGEPNDGQPTFPYDTPLSLHTGRYVDSSNTLSYQGPVRTVRSGIVRVAPSGSNRIYLALGAMVGAYTLDTFFDGKLATPMVALNKVIGISPNARSPLEKLAKPDQFFYAESGSSGWTTPAFDGQDRLGDLDADDRGYLYIGTLGFGWGVATDPAGADGSHLPYVVQVLQGHGYVPYLMSLRSGANYFVYYSNGDTESTLYDVTTPASPVFGGKRTGYTKSIRAWSKYEAGQRVALINLDGHARIYNYADLIANGAPLADLTPPSGKSFADLSFDDDGNLWLAETTNSISSNVLRRETPSGDTYTTTPFDVYGATAFSPRKIHASGDYIAVAGQITGSSDLRLLKVVGGSPQLQDTAGFVEKYYHRAPSGYADPNFISTLATGVRIVTQDGKTYLFYSAFGLGDVYELSDAPRITSMTPLTGDPAGGTEVSIYGSGFTVASTVTFDGITASSTFVSDALMTAISPPHVNGSVDVVVSATGEEPMTAPRQFTYAFPGPSNLAATATGATTVSITWSAVPGATRYEVARLSSNTSPQVWTVIGIVFGTSEADTGVAEKTYLYRVRAGDATTFSTLSSIDAVTMMNPDSDTIVAGSIIKSVDLTNLRTRVNGVRSIAGLFQYSYTDPSPTLVNAIHITQLRTTLTQARTALGLTTPAFTDTSLTGIPVKAVHFNELLDLMR
ncbi:MAG: IPT/TIG domain-containing protein [Acidobacteriota bacterium]|nr:IPT/TIG domain-containing protein [Acidobacteriota bacterium]